MSQEKLKLLQEELELKQKELNLVMAIDHIRDTAPDPSAMLAAIVNLLTNQLRVEFCSISLLDRETGQMELKAINDRSQPPHNLGGLLTPELARKAANLDRITIWDRESPELGLELSRLPSMFQVVAVPVVMGDNDRLGALLLARTQAFFGPNDIKLLETVESMVDSAVIQGYTDYELKQHIKELEAIYRVDHIRDLGLPFDEMLNAVLQELCTVIDAEVGFTMLYDLSGQQLELRATTHADLFKVSAHYEQLNRISNESLKKTELLCYNELSNAIRSLMCLPLILNEQIIGVLGVVNRRNSKGFASEDRQLLQAIGSQIDTAIFENNERRRLRQLLGRSVDPNILERLLASPNVDFLKGERTVLSVLYADLRGSTQLAEKTDPELMVGFINHYLGQMTDIILAHEGTLDKFVGDEVMALFGAPFPQDDHALTAVRVGLEMQRAHQTVVEIWQDRGIDAIPIGVGIATGELIAGEMGCPQRADYTVIGRAANLGSRICGAAKAGEVLISQETYDLVQDKLEATPVRGLQFKGFSHDITVYSVDDILD